MVRAFQNWLPLYDRKDNFAVMHLDTNTQALPEQHRDRYEFLDANGLGSKP